MKILTIAEAPQLHPPGDRDAAAESWLREPDDLFRGAHPRGTSGKASERQAALRSHRDEPQ